MRSSPNRDGKCKGGTPLEGIPFMLTQKKPITAVAVKPMQIQTQADTPNPDLYPSTCYKFSNFYLGGRADVSLDPNVKRNKIKIKIPCKNTCPQRQATLETVKTTTNIYPHSCVCNIKPRLFLYSTVIL